MRLTIVIVTRNVNFGAAGGAWTCYSPFLIVTKRSVVVVVVVVVIIIIINAAQF